MALIDKEIICAEIERRIKVAKVEYESTHAPEYEGIDIELNDLLAFLDTLPEQEQPEVDLDAEVDRFYRSDEYKMSHDLGRGFEAIAYHFFDFGCRRTAEMYDDIEYERQRAEEAEITKGLECETKK